MPITQTSKINFLVYRLLGNHFILLTAQQSPQKWQTTIATPL